MQRNSKVHQVGALRSAISPVGSLPKVDVRGGASPVAIGAMNWAAWEYQIACDRRKKQWHKAAGKKVPRSRVMIYDTRPASPYFKSGFVGFDFDKMTDRFSKVYGGAVGKGYTANMVFAQQQVYMSALESQWAEHEARTMAHMIDAMVYAAMMRPKGKIKFEFYERASRWQSNLIDLNRSSSVTLLPEPDTSRSDGNKSKRGWLSKTRRGSTAWLPTPRTKLIQCQKPAANLLA